MIDPVFGRKDPKLDYHTRIGAYGVIPDHSGARLLILQAPNHALFLPGGGVEEGETPEVTLARELLEEFGATVSQSNSTLVKNSNGKSDVDFGQVI